MKAASIGGILACLAASVSIAFAANPDDPRAAASLMIDTGPNKTIPLQTWTVDTKSFIANARQTRLGTAKAATDRATVYRPVPICRLIDTRGFPAAIAVAGPLAPNSTTNINSAGFCGIPSNFEVAGISLSFHVFNNTVNNGGYIVFQQQGAPITGVNAVFNPGAQWTAATANVSIPNDSGNFSIFVANSQVQVIVDVNGYFQDMDELDIGTQEFDINGTTTGNTFQVNNSGGGTALAASSSGNGSALNILSGSVNASGAGVNTSTFAFIHQVNTTPFGSGGTICGGFPEYTVIDHPMLNGDANAIVFVTARDSASLPTPNAGSWVAFYIVSSCTPTVTANWAIRDRTGAAHVNGSQFNVMVIKP